MPGVLHDFVQAPVGRSCGDPVEKILKSSLCYDLEDAVHGACAQIFLGCS